MARASVRFRVIDGARGQKPAPALPGRYRFGPFAFDAASGELAGEDGTAATLTPTVAALLGVLLANPRRVISKDELLDAVWAGRIVEEANIKQTVFTLRRALGDAGGRLIVTAPGRGYRLDADVECEAAEGGAPAPEAGSPEAAAIEAPPPRRRLPRPGVLAGLGVGALALAGAVGLILALKPHVRAATPGRPARIVLADFDNATHEAIFERTLSGVLRVDLAQSPYLSILSDREAQATLDNMGKPKGAPVTPVLAQEICARNNADEIVEGRIAPFGTHYLLSLRAADCTDEHTIAEAQTELARREDAIAGLETLAGKVRARLGEPARSVDRFSVPLIDVRTSSLEAVKAYSEGVWLNQHGQPAAALAPLQHAVELDPKFALPRFNMAVIYNNLAQHDRADAAVVAAYALRDQLNERERIKAEVYYTRIHSGDYFATIKALQRGVEIYPTDWSYWSNLSGTENMLGAFAAAAAAARRAIALGPPDEMAYIDLAVADLGLGDLKGAREACDQALQRGVGGLSSHQMRLEIALAAGDLPAEHAEEAWAASQPEDSSFLTTEARNAQRLGQIGRADGLFQRIAQLSGQDGAHDANLGFRARVLEDLGLHERARALLNRGRGQDNNLDFAVAQARLGDPALARRLLDHNLALSPDDTILRVEDTPEVGATLALRAGNAQAALTDLAPAAPYMGRGYDVLFLRARTYLALGDLKHAQADLQSIVDRPWGYPESVYGPLARVWLARTLLQQGQVAAADAQYRRFLDLWKDADPDLPILAEAKAELATGRLTRPLGR